jgi:hypothetical protein
LVEKHFLPWNLVLSPGEKYKSPEIRTFCQKQEHYFKKKEQSGREKNFLSKKRRRCQQKGFICWKTEEVARAKK